MNTYQIIMTAIFGAVCLASIYHTALYFFIQTKLLAVYCRYLWSFTLNSAFPVFFYESTLNDFYSLPAGLGFIFYQITILTYLIFIRTSFKINKKTHRWIWLIFKLNSGLIFLVSPISIYIRWYKLPEDNIILISLIILNSLLGLLLIFSIIYLYFILEKEKFSTFIFIGFAFNSFFIFLAFYINLIKSSPSIHMAHMIFMIGIFLEIVFFSIAMGYKFKESIAEKLYSEGKAIKYQLAMYNSEMQQENTIALARATDRKQLAQDLHDDLANSIANVKMRIESEILNSDNEGLKNRLLKISDHVTKAYERTRSKSHELFNFLNEETELAFKDRLLELLENTLPSKQFKKEIVVDEESLQNTSLILKTEILFIVQEAILNIQKHALANIVNILIYKDIEGLLLLISDDGIGFNTSINYKSVGLQSIKSRVSNLNGKLDIISDKTGTTIKVIFP